MSVHDRLDPRFLQDLADEIQRRTERDRRLLQAVEQDVCAGVPADADVVALRAELCTLRQAAEATAGLLQREREAQDTNR